MKATKPRIIALLVGVVAIGTASLYLAKFLSDFSAKTSVDNLLSTGMDLFQKGQYEDARAALEECYQKAKDGEVKNQALLFLSRCYTTQGDRKRAIESWNEVIANLAMADHHAEAFYSLAGLRSAVETAEDRQAAEEYYRKAMALAPESRFGELAEIEVASLLMDGGDLRGAQDILRKLQASKRDYPQLRSATFKLNMKLLFSPMMTEVPECEYYVVKQGDTLDGIARRFGTTADLLQESNGVDPLKLQIGKRLKLVTGKFRLKVSKSKYILQLLSEDVELNEYPIGTGKFGSTPVGKFRISDKVKEPPWFKDGRVIPYGHPENILGTRWMKIESTDGKEDLTGYGIHGTDDESSIGKESSQGCIRLLNCDVEELYKIVTVGTEVIIEE